SLSILLVAAELNWISTSRMPGALHHAGFEVTVLAPRDALVTKSRYARRIGHFPNDCTYPLWVQTLSAAIRAQAPALIVPGDDRSAQLLHRVIDDPPPGLIPALHARLVELIQRSLGDPRFYDVAANKFLLADAAIAAGVRVPEQRVVIGTVAAIEAARQFGYPAVLKRAHGSGGETVRIAADDSAVAQYAAQAPDAPVLVQRFIRGKPAAFGAVSLGGAFLGGITAIRLFTDPPQTGPGTVVQLVDRPDVAAAAAKMIEVLGISGFSSFDFLLEEDSGTPFLLECNPRLSVSSYIGTHYGADLSRDLYRALAGARDAIRAAPTQLLREQTIALFPQEWLRSPQSAALRSYVIDAPWDDPELFAATVKGAGIWPT
ncbi:MAG: ATP-grasp domain-containing protein, partial [Betaproteobacteria bacterium]